MYQRRGGANRDGDTLAGGAGLHGARGRLGAPSHHGAAGVEMAVTRDREECVRENTQRMTAAIEMMIRRHPDHWNWIHRRWKTRPEGEKRFY